MRRMLIVAGLVVLSVVTGSQAGITMTQTTKTDGQRKGEDAVVRFMAEEGMARVEFPKGGGMASKDGYIVTRDAGKTFYMVDPKEKSYMKFDMAGMSQVGAGIMKAMKPKITDPKVDKILDEAGPDMLGYPTRHYRIVTAYTMEMAIFGRKSISKVVQEEDIWVTTKIKFDVWKAWASKQQMSLGNEELEKLIGARKDAIQGVYLKHVMVNKSTDANNRETVTRSTTEVTEVKEGRLAATLFEMPEGYKEIDVNASIEGAMVEAQAESEKADKERGAKGKGNRDSEEEAAPPSMESILKMIPKP